MIVKTEPLNIGDIEINIQMSDAELIALFPKTKVAPKPRDTQLVMIKKTIQLLNSGHRKIMLCAPVGSGKSLYGIWIIRILMHYISVSTKIPFKGVYTSPLNVLVDQVENINHAATVKGKEHYPCNAGKLNAGLGYCAIGRCSISKKTGWTQRKCDIRTHKTRDSDEKPEPVQCEYMGSCPCWGGKCEYKNRYVAGMNHPILNTNFSLFQLGVAKNRSVVVVDECDAVDSFVAMNYGVAIQETISSDDYSQHIEKIRDHANYITGLLESIALGTCKAVLADKEILRQKRIGDKLRELLIDYEVHGSPWCVSYDQDGCTLYQPVDTTRFLLPLLDKKIVIMMSATPKPIEGFAMIEIPSTFPPANRPWTYIPVGKMGYKNRSASSGKIAKFILGLSGKTLVHCHSYSMARLLYDAIRNIDKQRAVLLQNNSRNVDDVLVVHDTYARKDIVSQFRQHPSPDAILLSVNLARGVDFTEPEIMNNVIAKMPWYDYRDPYVQARNALEGNTDWQDIEYAAEIMQAYGRLPRTPDKLSRCFIIDSDFNDPMGYGKQKLWYERHQALFWRWFKEAQLEMLLLGYEYRNIEPAPWVSVLDNVVAAYNLGVSVEKGGQ